MKKVVIAVLIIGAIIIGSSFLFGSKVRAPVQNNEQGQRRQQGQISQLNEPKETQNKKEHEVIYTDNGYLPSELTINVGDTVVWKNESSQSVWTASAFHPAHGAYGGTSLQEHCPDKENDDFDECKSSQPGESWSFTFNKAGTWKYHNHINSSHFGQVTVK